MNTRFFSIIISFVLILAIFSCVPPEVKPLKDSEIDFSDEVFRKILDFQDKRETDSIVKYLDHEIPLYRYAAVRAMISIQDSTKAGLIAAKLSDPDPLVREISAYGLGLLGTSRYQDSLMMVFGKYDTLNPNSKFNENILEALGRTGNNKYLKSIATISTYRPSDSLLIMGQIKSLYRFKYRRYSDPKGTERAIEILTSDSYPLKARFYATNYLMLCTAEELLPYKIDMLKILRNNENITLRKNIAIAAGKSADPQVLLLYRELLGDSLLDVSLRENLFKALKNFNYSDVIDIVVKNLGSNEPRIAYAAADYIYTNGLPNLAKSYKDLGDMQLHWKAKTHLYAAAMKHTPIYFAGTKARLTEELKLQFSQSTNPYMKAGLIRAIGEDINSYPTLYELGFRSDNLVVRTTSMEALGSIMKSDKIANLSSGAKKYYAKLFFPMLSEAISSTDPGLISAAADNIINSSLDYTEYLTDGKLIKVARTKIQLPRDAEASTGLDKLEAKIKNKKYVPSPVKYNQPIDWELFDELKDSLKVVVNTSKGNFEMVLFKKNAPGTVTSFVYQAKKGFFNNKIFHRVVPNFVIQTGCPRGDGYGSSDFTLRTEIMQLQYNDEGIVGMASAGRDTESTQWFVTLAPAPHLDGNYTIFGKVVKGMEMIRNIDVGDKINSIKIGK
ncbi:MAG: peptidylprolyl isomerase [Deltaproteobacteria bacterium]